MSINSGSAYVRSGSIATADSAGRGQLGTGRVSACCDCSASTEKSAAPVSVRALLPGVQGSGEAMRTFRYMQPAIRLHVATIAIRLSSNLIQCSLSFQDIGQNSWAVLYRITADAGCVQVGRFIIRCSLQAGGEACCVWSANSRQQSRQLLGCSKPPGPRLLGIGFRGGPLESHNLVGVACGTDVVVNILETALASQHGDHCLEGSVDLIFARIARALGPDPRKHKPHDADPDQYAKHAVPCVREIVVRSEIQR